MLPDWARLDAALHLALQRGSQDLYDEVVVVREDGAFAGLLSVRQMVVQQTHALAKLDGYICKGNPATLRLRVAAVLAR